MIFRKRSRRMYATELPNNRVKFEFVYDGVNVPWSTLPMIGDNLCVDNIKVEVISRTLYDNGEVELLTRIVE